MIALPAWTRFWWILPIAGLLAWAMVERAGKHAAQADLSAEQAAHAGTIANYTTATAAARAMDLENKHLTERLQEAESRRISDAYDARLADARARAAAARVRSGGGQADPGGGGGAAVSGVSGAARGADAAACEAGLPAFGPGDALIATEQAIQLDELINWVAAQQRLWAATQTPPAPKEAGDDE